MIMRIISIRLLDILHMPFGLLKMLHFRSLHWQQPVRLPITFGCIPQESIKGLNKPDQPPITAIRTVSDYQPVSWRGILYDIFAETHVGTISDSVVTSLVRNHSRIAFVQA
ncbi:MAG: hypothetical protein A2Z16_15020 [Chloroflexi bacterium RBG_16_54_18]|nr:MAG: hypothetical protein A2Z16_15020 [Chloroflexi bacterium RBG_16_54_18]